MPPSSEDSFTTMVPAFEGTLNHNVPALITELSASNNPSVWTPTILLPCTIGDPDEPGNVLALYFTENANFP